MNTVEENRVNMDFTGNKLFLIIQNIYLSINKSNVLNISK